MSSATTTQPLKLNGNGLITGLPVETTIEPAPAGHGVVFYLDGEVAIPARLECVVHTERGITLGHPSGKTLSIVEHFLAGVAMAGLSDLRVAVSGAPELPLMDGSAVDWYEALKTHFGEQDVEADVELPTGVFHRHDDQVCVYALPAERFMATYAVDFDHPDLQCQWLRWDSLTDEKTDIMKARTFGYVRDLPMLQAMGLAKGVTRENTVGLTDEGGYSTDLRMPQEPLYHKILDLMGDLMLTGINPRRLKAHVFAINAGHPGHTAFARKMLKSLTRPGL